MKKHSSSIVKVSDYEFIHNKFQISKDDICVISGGEPTLSPYFYDIVDFCRERAGKIFVYSNGRTINTLPKETLSKIDRVLIPLYGDKAYHDKYTNVTGAYNQTIQSIQNVLVNDKDKIEIKIMLHDGFNVKEFFDNPEIRTVLSNNHFSVTRILKQNGTCTLPIIQKANDTIIYLLDKGKTVRFYDFPFCKFSDSLKNLILNKVDYNLIYDTKIICGSSNHRYKLFDFNSKTNQFARCINCEYQMLCVEIMHNYFCPEVNVEGTKITTE